MIIVNLIGGLGNQMFQYACGRALSLKTGNSLYITTDQFKNYKLHNGFELNRIFNIDAKFASESDLSSMLGWKSNHKVRWLLGRPEMRWLTGKNWCCEPHISYWPEINNIAPPIYLHGYWQSEKYFIDVEEIIRKEFTFKLNWDNLDLSVLHRMKKHPSASLHVRRGDYLTKKNKKVFANCEIDYYIKAVNILKSKIPNLNLFVFSDDPDWVLRYLHPEIGEFELVTHNTGSRSSNDMRLMASTDHHIIANSSFSWWGAWLNSKNNKTVICPRNWFANSQNTSTLTPENWIKV